MGSLLRDAGGSIAVMSALAGTCLVGCLALAVDIGSLHLERRRLQNVADLAAIAAVNEPADAEAAVQGILAANGVSATAEVEAGTFTPDFGLAPALRYASGGTSPNAARVILTSPGTLYFARVFYGGPPPQIRVSATAAQENVAEFSIGSRLAALNEGTLNTLFGELLGSTVDLTVMDYEGLVDADIDLVDFMQALAGEVGVAAGTYDSVLDSGITFGNVLDAAALVASEDGANAAEIALNKLELAPGGVYALPLSGSELLDLGDLGDLSVGERPAGFTSRISAFDLVRAAVNAAGPNNQAQVSFGSGVPGLASLVMSVAIGEPPQGTSWITLGPERAEVYTAQTRVRVAATVGPLKVAGVNVSLQVPLALDIASGKARLEHISCGTDPAEDAVVGLAVRPALGSLYLGTPDNLDDWQEFDPVDMQPPQIVTVAGLIGVTAEASATATNSDDINIEFDVDDIANKTVKTANTATPLSTLVSSVFSNLDVSATFLGFGLPLPGLLSGAENAVRAALAPVASAIEPKLETLLDSLGIGLGEADVRVYGVRCGAPALVM